MVPKRFSTALRISKLFGPDALVAAVFDQRSRALGQCWEGPPGLEITDVVPHLRLLARQLMKNADAA